MYRLRRYTAALLACLSFGCGHSGPKPDVYATAPVKGILTFQGQPLPSFEVVFTPTDGSKRPSVGRTDSEGRFTLGTNGPGDGATVGTHQVSVAFAPEIDSLNATPVENPADMPKPSVKIPEKYSSPATSGLTLEVPKGGLLDLKLNLE